MARHVSYSEITTYRQCPTKWKLSYVDGWRPAEVSAPLTKGRLFHEVLAAHYTAIKEGADPAQAVAPLIETPGDEELRSLMGWMYEGYLAAYGLDPKWQILAVEQRKEFPLVTATGHRSRIMLVVVIDLLAADELGRVWLIDHKTGGRFPSELGLELSDQFPLYQWALGQAGLEVHGVLYNLIRTQRNKGPMSLDERFKRIPMYRTERQLANTALDAWRTARRMYAGPYVERATDSEMCIRKCPFTEPCLYSRKGGRIEDFLESQGYVKSNGNGDDRATEENAA